VTVCHTFFSKAGAKVLLFFDMTKYFQKKMQKSGFFYTFAIFWSKIMIFLHLNIHFK